MKQSEKYFLRAILLVLSFFLVSSAVTADFFQEDIRNTFACNDAFSFRQLGRLQGDPSQGIGVNSQNQWADYFSTQAAYTNTCLPGEIRIAGDADQDDAGGVLFGGFLYVVEEQGSDSNNGITAFFSISGGYSSEEVISDVSYLLYQVPSTLYDQTFTQQSFGNYISELDGSGQDMYMVYENLRDNRGHSGARETDIFVRRSIAPGLYFIGGGVDFYIGRRNGGRDYTTIFRPVRFGSQTTYDTDANLNNAANGYAITNRLLSASEITTTFGENRVEALEFLCELSGGAHATAVDRDNNSAPYSVCCGNNPSDLGQTHWISRDGQIFEDRCVQQGDGGFTWQNDVTVCEDAGGDFNVNAQENYDATDGSDGCCGDDPNDVGYRSADGNYFCNRDRSAEGFVLGNEVAEEEREYYFWETSPPYQIHEVGETDFISNGNEWYQCVPQDTNRTNLNIGLGEYMAEPFGDFASISTCVDAMNFFLDNSLFDGLTLEDPAPGTRFGTGDDSNSQAPWTCSPEVDNSMNDDFFSTQSLSCIDSCYMGSGVPVESLFTTAAEFQNHFCIPGFDIPGCPDVIVGDDVQIGDDGVQSVFDTTFAEANIACTDIVNIDGHTGYTCNQPDDCAVINGEKSYYVLSEGDFSATRCCKAPSGSRQEDVCVGEQEEEIINNVIEEEEDNSALAFICSPWNTQERFLECCPGVLDNTGRCYAQEFSGTRPLHYQMEGQSNGLYVTAGGSNYLVEDFNSYEDQALVEGYFSVENIGANGNELVIDFDTQFLGSRDNTDWRGFRELHFDVRYNVDFTSTPYELILVYEGQNQQEITYQLPTPLSNYLVTGSDSGKFQHAIIPLPQDIVTAKSITIRTDNNQPGVRFDIDHIYLANHGSDYQERFCAGDHGIWVENLDGPSDDGFSEDSPGSEFDEYQTACNGVPSFGWTGTRCCGDDTTATKKETYVDLADGCFEGNIVRNNKVVSIDTQNDEYGDLLYSDGIYYYCDAGLETNPYEELTNTHGFAAGENIADTRVVGELVADHACSDTGEWINVGAISKTKELASYMYSILSREDVYGLHCQSMDKVSPLDQSDENHTLSYFTAETLDAFCAGQIEESDYNPARQRTLLGFTISDSQENFMNALARHLVNLQVLEELEAETFVESCTQLDFTGEDEFYSCLAENNQKVRVLIHQEKPIYLVSYVEDSAIDFNQLFAGDSLSDFIDNVIYFFNNLFTNLFVEDEEDSIDSRLPSILASNAFDLDALVIQTHQIDEDTYKSVVGFIEAQDLAVEPIDDASQIVVEYSNFYSSVEPLVQPYLVENSLNYQKGTNRQVIQFTVSQAEQNRNSFEPAFDWRRFTSALRIDDTTNGSFITGQLNDGVLDIGEECDVYENGTVILKNIVGSTCEDYAPNVYAGSNAPVLCQDGVVDLRLCNFCGDGFVDEGEECDGGIGCSAGCQLEFCGDGETNNVGEVCDDGNTISEGYQAVSCAVANNCNAQCSGFGGCIGDSLCQAEELAACSSNPLDNVDCGFCDVDGDGVTANNDCDDTDPTVSNDCPRDDAGDSGSGDSGSTCNERAGEFDTLAECNSYIISQSPACWECGAVNSCFVASNLGIEESPGEWVCF